MKEMLSAPELVLGENAAVLRESFAKKKKTKSAEPLGRIFWEELMLQKCTTLIVTMPMKKKCKICCLCPSQSSLGFVQRKLSRPTERNIAVYLWPSVF